MDVFTWFANAFDNDDVSFRLLTMVVKLVGALCAMGAALLAPVLTVPGSVLLIGVIVVAVVACGARPDRAELSDGQDAGNAAGTP